MSVGILEEGKLGEREAAGENPRLTPTAQNWVVGVASVQYWNDPRKMKKRRRRKKHV